jgi:hypothetical protein
LSWITAEGTIDLAELPIDDIFKQAVDPRIGAVSLRMFAPL